MKNKIVIHLSRTPEGVGMRIAGTNEAEFDVLLRLFKECLPAGAREYDADLKLWIVEPDYYPSLRSWCAGVVRHFGARVDDGWSGVRTSPATPPPHLNIDVELALRELHLLPGALDFPELVAAAREILAARYNPDALGGDSAKAKEIEAAFDVLTRAFVQDLDLVA